MWRWVPKAFGLEATVKDCCNKCQRIGSIKEAMSPPIGVLMYESGIMWPSAYYCISDTFECIPEHHPSFPVLCCIVFE